jgi:anti-anti-sigma regulatory factor
MGRITLETAELFKSEVKNLAPGHQRVLADLSEVDFVDSSGLGSVLVAVYAHPFSAQQQREGPEVSNHQCPV